MKQLLIFLFSLWIFCSSVPVLSQEIVDSIAVDSRYREDQFYLGITYNVISSVPEGVSTSGLSGGVQFGFLRDMPINKQRNIAIAVGAGLSFDQYGQNLFIGETEEDTSIFTVLNEDNVTFDRNRFSTAVVELPVEFRWRTSTAESYRFWRIYAGFRIGYAYWYKSTLIQDNNNIDQTDIPEFEQLRTRATLSFGNSKINFFGSYSLNPFFKDATTTKGEMVDFKAIKVGLIFYIL